MKDQSMQNLLTTDHRQGLTDLLRSFDLRRLERERRKTSNVCLRCRRDTEPGRDLCRECRGEK